MNKDNLNLIGKYTFSFLCIVAGCVIYVTCNEADYHGFIRNFVPDFLWMMAFMFALAPLFRFIFDKEDSNFITFIVCSFLGIIFEFCQYMGVVNGTGDFLDILTYLIAGLISNILFLVEDIIRASKEDKNG